MKHFIISETDEHHGGIATLHHIEAEDHREAIRRYGHDQVLDWEELAGPEGPVPGVWCSHGAALYELPIALAAFRQDIGDMVARVMLPEPWGDDVDDTVVISMPRAHYIKLDEEMNEE